MTGNSSCSTKSSKPKSGRQTASRYPAACRGEYVISVLHNTVQTIDDQPLWGKVLQNLFSPLIGLACLIIYSIRARRWLVVTAFLLGIVAYETYSSYQFIESMKQVD